MLKISKLSGLAEARGHHFYARKLDEKSVIIDLGSHLGEFSTEISESLGCMCYAVEALPSLYAQIPETNRIKKLNYAITDANRKVSFCVTDNPEGNYVETTESDKEHISNKIVVDGVSISSLIKTERLEHIDLLKVDIEGSEIAMFDSMSDSDLQKISQLSIEFHDFILDIKSDVRRIMKRLKSLGFLCIKYSFRTNGDILFINSRNLRINPFDYAYIYLFSKYTHGFHRLLERVLIVIRSKG